MQTLQHSSSAVALDSKFPFPEIQFLRMIVWKACQNEIKPHGRMAAMGQVFQRYLLPFMKGVSLDFYCRGPVLSPFAARALAQTLSAEHVLDGEELNTLEETLSTQWLDPLLHDGAIEHAQVGDLNGQLALAIQWNDRVRDLKRISLYFCTSGDARNVREIHFTAPVESFDLARKYLSEVLRTIQWYG
jgi:hypothetical protein